MSSNSDGSPVGGDARPVGANMRLQAATDPISRAALSLAANVFSELILPTAVQLHKTLVRNDEEPSVDALWPSILDTTLFCCHCLDRIAFMRVGPEPRLAVMDCVLLFVVESLCNRFDTTEARGEFCDTFFDSWTRFQHTYAPMVLVSADGESPRDTMLWEWAKDVTFRRTINPATAMELFMLANDTLTVLADSWDALWQPDPSTPS